MHRFIAFVRKEIFHILRDWRTLIILIGMPIIQILVFGFAITNEINNARIAILDNARDHHSAALINKVLSSGYFRLETYLNSPMEIEGIFRKGKVKEVIVIENNFGTKLEKENKAAVQLILDAADPNSATMILNYTQAIITDYQISQNQLMNLPFTIGVTAQMFYNQELKGAYMFVPGLITIILMLVTAMMTSISITKEKELGTMEILLATPMKPGIIIIGKVVPYLFLAFTNAHHRIAARIFCIRSAYKWKPAASSWRNGPLHTNSAFPGHYDLHNHQQSAGGADDIAYGSDAADYVAVRISISYRKYAVAIADRFKYCPCKMVHYHHKNDHVEGSGIQFHLEGITDSVWLYAVFPEYQYQKFHAKNRITCAR